MEYDLWRGAEVISAYTRAQALEDGVLVEVPWETAQEAGLRWTLALTAAAWADTVAWDEQTEALKPIATGQDEAGRLWDVLTMVAYALRRSPAGADRATVEVMRVPAQGRALRPQLVRLQLVAGPGDVGEPVLTLMLSGED